MRFTELLHTVADLPVFRGSLLLAGDQDPADVRRQLSRWQASGKVVRLRRNVYVLAEPWRRVQPHPFLVANELQRPSYVSLESALAHHAHIPEAVPVTTSVTTGRPGEIETPLGRYLYRRIRPEVFFGYSSIPVFREQRALMAGAAKALLDLVYLTPGGDAIEYLEALRLEGLEDIRAGDLRAHARRWDKPKIDRAVENLLAVKRSAAAGQERP